MLETSFYSNNSRLLMKIEIVFVIFMKLSKIVLKKTFRLFRMFTMLVKQVKLFFVQLNRKIFDFKTKHFRHTQYANRNFRIPFVIVLPMKYGNELATATHKHTYYTI